jgi:PAS domain S-box-containing protein
MISNILIVDDDKVMLDGLADMLRTRLTNITVDVSTTADGALDQITATDYDAIVTDIKMPGMDGLQLMERVLSMRPTTPTLVITGHAGQDLGVQAMAAGAYAFIEKPIDRDSFLSWLKGAIHLSQLTRAAQQQNQMLQRTVQERTVELERTNCGLKAALEQARQSEERYRNLYESIDEGFCIIEVKFDENNRAMDYMFVEINPSFERQTGIKDARGKSMRDIAPHHEEHWFELYGKIALTGESLRFEYPAVELHRWYEGYAYRIGEAHERKVAIIFNDITERKRAEGEREKLVTQLETERERLKDFQGQLQEKIADLEKFNDVVVGRELKMMELERELQRLRAKRGDSPRLRTV